jgi:hypothetical protein
MKFWSLAALSTVLLYNVLNDNHYHNKWTMVRSMHGRNDL